MKHINILAFCFLSSFLIAQNPVSQKTTLLSHWEPTNQPFLQWGYIHYNSCWGHANPDGREYAILGGTDRIMFVDITNPTTPVELSTFYGQTPTVWREFKSYRNRIYAVADASQEGLQIFDMTNAPDTIVRTYYNNEFFGSSHTITMDTARGLIFLNAATGGCVKVLDVSANPDQPVLVGTMNLQNCSPHDSWYEDNKFFLSNGNNGLAIYDLSQDMLNPTLMATISTNGYNHSGCTDISGRYFYYLEEIPEGRPGRIVDLQNLAAGDIELVGQFFDPLLAPASTNAIYHNPFRKGNLLFIGAYQDGLVVYDIAKPTEPKLVAWYDTYQNTTYSGYTGVWSVYPWLPSGNVIIGDMVSGLYLVKLDASVTNTTSVDPAPVMTISPNPVHDQLQINLSESFDDLTEVWVFNSLGQVVQQGRLHNNQLQLSGHPAGLYYLQLRNDQGQVAQAAFVKI
jgi:choice-of-anchor B domain-containing protein